MQKIYPVYEPYKGIFQRFLERRVVVCVAKGEVDVDENKHVDDIKVKQQRKHQIVVQIIYLISGLIHNIKEGCYMKLPTALSW